MRQKSGFQAVAGNPTLVGAVTILIAIVAVFLAYNAHTGLPFVPTYKITAQVPDANALVDFNEVRVGGNRAGVVERVRPHQFEDGRVGARLDLKLDQRLEPVPVDSTLIVRTRSTLGLKYVELVLGDSDEGFADGSVMPLAAATPEPVDLDDFFNMFDERTRDAIHLNLTEFSKTFAGRGAQLNQALGVLPNMLRYAQPVARLLADPATDFDGFWRALEQMVGEIAPVAEQQASMFVAMDVTFSAFARVARPYIQDTIVKSPPTLDAVTEALPVMRPFLRSSAEFFEELQPGARALGETSPIIAEALAMGVPVLRATPRLNRQLAPSAQALVDFQEAPGAMDGLRLLTRTNRIMRPGFEFIAPAQTTCNYLSLVFRRFANIGADGDGLGHWLRVIAPAPPGDNPLSPETEARERYPNIISEPASGPASGPARNNHLHYNPYPYTAAPGQPFACEAGNERYAVGTTVIGNTGGPFTTNTAEQLPHMRELPRIKP